MKTHPHKTKAAYGQALDTLYQRKRGGH
jgi:hypothetical protein